MGSMLGALGMSETAQAQPGRQDLLDQASLNTALSQMIQSLQSEICELRKALEVKTFEEANSVEAYIRNDTFMLEVMQTSRAQINFAKEAAALKREKTAKAVLEAIEPSAALYW